ncbi:MAG TPA: hypothetical protein VGO60_13515 [Iamia sp.]|jgi:hypothetical protein|nr:hypothetical protein [Iamia sp.]
MGVGLLISAVFGASVGVAELLLRYRDAPLLLFKKVAAWCYVGFNAGAAVLALWIVTAMDWTFGQTTDTKIDMVRILVAGFGSIALFRSNLFIVKTGDENIGAGPSLVLAGLLGAADVAVDRQQAQARAEDVRAVMDDVSFDAARESLVSVALTASVSVTPKATEDLRTGISALGSSTSIPDQAKSYVLGLMLIDVVGVEVLRQSVTTLGDSIKAVPPPPPPPPPAAEGGG